MFRDFNKIVKKLNWAWLNKVKLMAENAAIADSVTAKRPASPENETNGKKRKKNAKPHVVQLGKSEGFKRKVAMLVAYNGAGYYGVQVNPGFPTIESEIFPALVKVGGIPQDHAVTTSKMWFQRGSRTDKNVSAVDFVSKMNEILPAQIRVIGYVRTTNGFDSKNFCCSRTYMYMMPTFAFAPVEKFVTDEYRTTPEIIDRARLVLKRYLGTHNFHNFTSGVKYEQASASRYMINFECSDPYVREGIEFVTLRVKGQSFMLHQIRKMIGLTIGIIRGYCTEATIDAAWRSEKVDIPIAPGLGLVLEQLHFDGYNKKWGCDGVHDPVEWSSHKEVIEDFKEKFIISDIVAQEKKDRVMMNWLQTLQFHNFSEIRTEGPQRPWVRTEKLLKEIKDSKESISDIEVSAPDSQNEKGKEANTDCTSSEKCDIDDKASNSEISAESETIHCMKPSGADENGEGTDQSSFSKLEEDGITGISKAEETVSTKEINSDKSPSAR